jgi:hypothetical protein
MCHQCNCQSSQEFDCGCGCGGCGHSAHFTRRYQTKAEQISELEAHLTDLKTEVQAVEERLVDLRK